jgi:hypothetical protein
MRRPCHRIGRTAFPPSPKILRQLLQHHENAPLIGQGCACLAPRSAGRTHRVACHGRRATSPICSNLSFRHTQVRTQSTSEPAKALGFLIAEKGQPLATPVKRHCTSSPERWGFLRSLWRGNSIIYMHSSGTRAEVARCRAAREVGVAASKMVPAKNTWSWRLS